MDKYINTIQNVDCLEFMKSLPDKCVDLIVTDPPYGDNIGYGRYGKEIENNEDESVNYRLIPLAYQKLKSGGVMYLFTNWKFSPLLISFINKNTSFKIRMQLVIVKNNIGMGFGFRNQYELCLVLEKDECVYNLKDFSNVMKMQHINHDKDSHPHEKGIEIIKKMVEHSSKIGDIVFDPFAGSGTTLVACKELGRKYIGCEISPKYCEIIKQRLSQDLLF